MMPAVRPGIAWTVPVVCAALLGGAFLLEQRTGSGVFNDPEVVINAPLSLGFAVLGALVISRRPEQGLGWLYLGSATAMATTLLVYEYAHYGLVTHPDGVPGATLAAWLSAWVWALGFAPLFTLGLLLYPDSRLPGRRWRLAAGVSVVAVACLALRPALEAGPLENHPMAANPLGIEDADPLLRLLAAGGYPLMLLGFVSGLAALVVRWRRSPSAGVERRQISLLLVPAVCVCLVLLSELFVGDEASWPAAFVALFAMSAVPVAIGVAILRHHLYDIEVVLNRSLVYGGLTWV